MKPAAALFVRRGIGPERFDEDIHVGQDHRSLWRGSPSSMNANTSALLVRSSPGATWLGWPTGNSTLGRAPFCRANSERNPFSISDVRVSPRRCASRLASSRRFSSNRTVVLLICLDIPHNVSVCHLTQRHKYPNLYRQ